MITSRNTIAACICLVVAGCGASDATGSGGAGGAVGAGGAGGDDTTATTTATSTATTTAATTTSSTGGGLPGCAGADEFELGDTLSGDLVKEGQEDYYRFEGKKGQVLWIDIDAQDVDNAAFDPTYIDTVIAITDADGKRIAENNNPVEFSTNDSRLYAILPADGTYCVRVAECWTAATNPAAACQEPKEKTNTFYDMVVYELVDQDPADANNADPEGGNDATSAAPIDYAPAQTGYFATTIWGFYETDADVDVYSFSLPSDVSVPSDARAHASFTAFPSGQFGSGSSNATGKFYVVDPLEADVVIARIDPSKSYEMDLPLPLDKEYLLFVTKAPGGLGPNPFYILRHFPGWGNPVETNEAGNNDPLTAEPLTFADEDSAFIEGDLPDADLDHFAVDVPGGTTTVSAVCGARVSGSGLMSLTLSLLKADGTPLVPNAKGVETASQLARVNDLALGSETKVVLKVEAGALPSDITGRSYKCGVHFSAP